VEEAEVVVFIQELVVQVGMEVVEVKDKSVQRTQEEEVVPVDLQMLEVLEVRV
jgi:hypothetical protein